MIDVVEGEENVVLVFVARRVDEDGGARVRDVRERDELVFGFVYFCIGDEVVERICFWKVVFVVCVWILIFCVEYVVMVVLNFVVSIR